MVKHAHTLILSPIMIGRENRGCQSAAFTEQAATVTILLVLVLKYYLPGQSLTPVQREREAFSTPWVSDLPAQAHSLQG